MKETYPTAFNSTLKFEGGFSNNPADPGGPTMHGIIQREFDVYRRQHGLAPQSVRFITWSEISDIYRTKYWDVIRGDLLPPGIDFATYDFAVNSGTRRAIRFLQMAVNKTRPKGMIALNTDGWIGPVTLDTMEHIDTARLLTTYIRLRITFLHNLLHLWTVFGAGWRARVVGRVSPSGTLLQPGVLQQSLHILTNYKETIDPTTSKITWTHL